MIAGGLRISHAYLFLSWANKESDRLAPPILKSSLILGKTHKTETKETMRQKKREAYLNIIPGRRSQIQETTRSNHMFCTAMTWGREGPGHWASTVRV